MPSCKVRSRIFARMRGHDSKWRVADAHSREWNRGIRGAVTSCGIVWARAKGAQSVRKIAAWLTAIESVLLLDMILDGRWILHQFFVNIAQNQHEYGLRRSPQ